MDEARMVGAARYIFQPLCRRAEVAFVQHPALSCPSLLSPSTLGKGSLFIDMRQTALKRLSAYQQPINLRHLSGSQRAKVKRAAVFIHLSDGAEAGDGDALLAACPQPGQR